LHTTFSIALAALLYTDFSASPKPCPSSFIGKTLTDTHTHTLTHAPAIFFAWWPPASIRAWLALSLTHSCNHACWSVRDPCALTLMYVLWVCMAVSLCMCVCMWLYVQ
jgi:hypothetical protein